VQKLRLCCYLQLNRYTKESSANKSQKKVLYSHANSQQQTSCLQHAQLYKITFLLYKTSKFCKVHKSRSFNYTSPLELIIQKIVVNFQYSRTHLWPWWEIIYMRFTNNAHHYQDFLSVHFICQILFTNLHFCTATYHFFIICLLMCWGIFVLWVWIWHAPYSWTKTLAVQFPPNYQNACISY